MLNIAADKDGTSPIQTLTFVVEPPFGGSLFF